LHASTIIEPYGMPFWEFCSVYAVKCGGHAVGEADDVLAEVDVDTVVEDRQGPVLSRRYWFVPV
jgi:hypothetical protein